MLSQGQRSECRNPNIEALIIRIGFWGPIDYNYSKEPPKPYSSY